MSDSYESKTELLNRVTHFTSKLASMGVRVEAICFCESTAAEIFQWAEHQGQHFCEKQQSRVKHVVSHGTINGVKITSPGDRE